MCGHYIQGSGFNRRKVAETCVVYLLIDLQCIGNTCHLNIFEVHWNVQCLVNMFRNFSFALVVEEKPLQPWLRFTVVVCKCVCC
jgi:hypothetical protein